MIGKLFKNEFKTKILDKKILHIVKHGIKYSLIICMFATLILVMYCEKSAPQAFYVGISLLKSALFFMATFIICGFVFDK